MVIRDPFDLSIDEIEKDKKTFKQFIDKDMNMGIEAMSEISEDDIEIDFED